MHVKQELLDRDSREEFKKELVTLADAGAGIIHVRAFEVIRCAMWTREVIVTQTVQDPDTQEVFNPKHYEWNITEGVIEVQPDKLSTFNLKGDGVRAIGQVFSRIIQDAYKSMGPDGLAQGEPIYYTIINPQYWFSKNPEVAHYMELMATVLPPSSVRCILITPDEPLPDDLSRHVVSIHYKAPGVRELRAALDDVLQSIQDSETERTILSISDDDMNTIAMAGNGMSIDNFQLHAAVAAVNRAGGMEDDDVIRADDIIQGIAVGKTELIKQSDLLELYHQEDIENVGGMDVLKAWVRKRRACYSDAAADFGIESPKGIVFVGVPGSGKSLMAKAIAGELRIPLVRLDFGKVFNALVGSSEERIRKALSLVEAMAPCVLFIDEVDKGLAGMGGSGDAGTSSRVLGTFLTWLNDNKTPVFTVVTANNVTHLPPEFLRKGRFDQIFTSGLPNRHEIEEVLEIHLRKRNWDFDEIFERKELLERLVTKLAGFVPAEIEAVVKDALIESFSDGEELTAQALIKAVDGIKPLVKTHTFSMLETLAWSRANGVMASSDYIDRENVSDDGTVSLPAPTNINTARQRRRVKTTQK